MSGTGRIELVLNVDDLVLVVVVVVNSINLIWTRKYM
jgi:hypothetical protein